MSNLGHNSEAEIIRCINSKLEEFIESEQKFEKLQEELDTKKEYEQEPILLDLGASLFEGKKFTKDPNCGVKGDNPDARFNAWVLDNFPNLSDTINEKDRQAVIWSAEHREDYWDIKERYPRTKTIRGRHAKWKQEQKAKDKPDEDNTNDNDEDVVDNDDTSDDTKGCQGSQGNSDKPSWNTDNPDTSKVKEPISRIASSMVGVVTTIKFWEQTNGKRVDTEELANALLHEIRNEALEVYTEEEVVSYVDDIRYAINIISQSLPILSGPDTNIVNFKQTKEKSK